MGLSMVAARLRRPRALVIVLGTVAAAGLLSGCTANEALICQNRLRRKPT